MDEHTPTAPSAPPPASPLQAVIAIAILIPAIAGYYILGAKIGVQALYMGFLFSTYWGAIEMMNPARFLPTLGGGLLGIFVAWLLHVLPQAYGIPGLIAAIAATIVPVYFFMRQQLPLFCNVAFYVFITVATIPELGVKGDYLGMVYGTLYGAVFIKIAQLILQWVATRQKPAAPAAGPA